MLKGYMYTITETINVKKKKDVVKNPEIKEDIKDKNIPERKIISDEKTTAFAVYGKKTNESFFSNFSSFKSYFIFVPIS